jgi:drug/metabolite transporter (DMT)-like permease
VAANALFALASGEGLLSLVSVLGSLYPVVTVLLALVLLHERLTRTQAGGVAVALAGVAVLSAG